MIKPVFYYQEHHIRKVLVVGLGISGISVVQYLNAYVVDIEIFDQNTRNDHYVIDYDVFDKIDLEAYDLIVVAPGIPINRSPFNQLKSHWHKVVGDIELFSAHVMQKMQEEQEKQKAQKIIAVTGSNGKSTVVSLLYHILNSLGFCAALGGNIGIPALSLLDDKVDVYVLEISSFQIDLLKKARFDVVSVLNLSPDHLDRYEDYNAYCDAKLALLARGEYVVMNGKQKALITDLMYKNLHYFNADNAYVNGEKTIFADEVFCEQSEIILQGKHNLENILAVLVILQGLISVDHRLLLKLKEAIARFEPLAHRCRLVNICSGVKYINDSKATNIASAEAALVGLGSDSKNIIILLGGMAKGADFSELTPVLKRYVKKALVYGRDRMLIYNAIAKEVDCALYDNLDQAFTAGCSLAQENDIVLLSPGCASFDGFLNYVHRGEHFEKLVSELR